MSNGITISRRPKRADQIVRDLKRWIIASGKRPGDRLPQEKLLISLFSSSRGTIREALKSLEVQGLIEVVPGPKGGAHLKQLPLEDAIHLLTNFLFFDDVKVRDVYVLRIALEPILVRDVIGCLSEKDFEDLKKTIQACHDNEYVDPLKQRVSELEFHNILAARSSNRLLSFVCSFLNHLLYNFVSVKSQTPDVGKAFSDHVICSHEEILDALGKGDANTAEALMREHMLKAAKLTKKLDVNLDRQSFVDAMLSLSGNKLGWVDAEAPLSDSLEAR